MPFQVDIQIDAARDDADGTAASAFPPATLCLAAVACNCEWVPSGRGFVSLPEAFRAIEGLSLIHGQRPQKRSAQA